jgi:hypothetical protein
MLARSSEKIFLIDGILIVEVGEVEELAESIKELALTPSRER